MCADRRQLQRKNVDTTIDLDKSHTFAVCMFDDFDRYQKVPEEYVPLEITPYQPKVCHHTFCIFIKCERMCDVTDGRIGEYLQLHVGQEIAGSVCDPLQRRDRDLLVGWEKISALAGGTMM